MKKILIPFFLLIALFSNAQEIKVKKVTQINTTKEGSFSWAEFVPESDLILASKSNFQSLFLINKKTKQVTEISNNMGAGYKPLISADGKTITFRSDEFKDNLKYSELKEYSVENQTTYTIVRRTRNLSNASYLNGDLVFFEDHDQKILKNKTSNPKNQQKLVQTIGLKPYILSDDSNREYLPSGEGNYIWVSLSPDKSKLVYNFNGQSTFVSDLDGNILANLGHFHAPKWLNNDLLIGMNDKDNGDITTSSDIVSYSLKTKSIQYLTKTDNKIEMYPSVSPDASQIIFQTEKGELYLMNIKL